MEKLLYSRREVAALIGLSVATVESLVKSGQLTSIRVGRLTRISATALAEFAATGTSNRTAKGTELGEMWRTK